MKYLFENWKNIRAGIQQANTLFLFLDYDGTLTSIVSRPELAVCPLKVRKYLEELRDLPGVYLAIISGRSVQDVREKVGVSGIIYVGNHGLEIENPAGSHKKVLSQERKTELERITQDCQISLKAIPGILFEKKGPVLSVHYRNVDRRFLAQIHRLLEEKLWPRRDHWELATGKMVLEIRPRMNFSKGGAVREILRYFPSTGLLTFYVGDDQTDEDGFLAVKGSGISVYVGPSEVPLRTDFFVRSPEEVQEFLFRCYCARRQFGKAFSSRPLETNVSKSPN